ncbi:hypothetical protein [Salinicola avicenniae]|uniref:hypothetical protein n=1 Tax=Salinicola avicenniae TaxID=2916836 RepID=UPI002072C6BB|nr:MULTISPECIES: hypothetical protein [unclassified Salinicola]
MKDAISCTRCGHTQTTSTELHQAWDEITCTECGDFLDTVGHRIEANSPHYLVQMLNLSRQLTQQMSRQARAVNDHPLAMRKSA